MHGILGDLGHTRLTESLRTEVRTRSRWLEEEKHGKSGNDARCMGPQGCIFGLGRANEAAHRGLHCRTTRWQSRPSFATGGQSCPQLCDAPTGTYSKGLVLTSRARPKKAWDEHCSDSAPAHRRTIDALARMEGNPESCQIR